MSIYVEAVQVAIKIERSGYSSLTQRELFIAGYLLTAGGCPSCGAR